MTLKLEDFDQDRSYILTRMLHGKPQFLVVFRKGDKIHVHEDIGSIARVSLTFDIDTINQMRLEFVDPHKSFAKVTPVFEKGQEVIFERGGEEFHFEVTQGGSNPFFLRISGQVVALPYTLKDLDTFDYRFVKVVPQDRYFATHRINGMWVVMDRRTSKAVATFDGFKAKKFAKAHAELMNKEEG